MQMLVPPLMNIILFSSFAQDGKKAFEAGDARKEDSIVSFMRNPQEPPPPPPPEKPWSDEKNEIEHLVEVNFKTALKQKKHYLVMFYAPWQDITEYIVFPLLRQAPLSPTLTRPSIYLVYSLRDLVSDEGARRGR